MFRKTAIADLLVQTNIPKPGCGEQKQGDLDDSPVEITKAVRKSDSQVQYQFE